MGLNQLFTATIGNVQCWSVGWTTGFYTADSSGGKSGSGSEGGSESESESESEGGSESGETVEQRMVSVAKGKPELGLRETRAAGLAGFHSAEPALCYNQAAGLVAFPDQNHYNNRLLGWEQS